MVNKKDIIELHKKQLKLEIDAIRLAIQHKAAKGSEAELTEARQAPMLGIGESERVKSNLEKERLRDKLSAWR